MTDSGGLDLDQNFAVAGPVELHGFDGKRFSCLEGHGGANVHFVTLSTIASAALSSILPVGTLQGKTEWHLLGQGNMYPVGTT